MNEVNMTYCPICQADVEYSTKDTNASAVLEDKEYAFIETHAYCNRCGQELFIDALHDQNLINLYEEYRKDHNIILYAELLEILNKYAIGKRPFSLILGWGEQTITRYLNGAIPTSKYSDELKAILNSPNYYLSILENNKDRIKDAAYNKSLRAVLQLLNDTSNISKIEQVANYLLSQCKETTPLALQKALYYCQGFFSAFYDRYLFDDECQAWTYGPVYPGIYAKYKEYVSNPITATEHLQTDLSITEKNLIDCVVRYICCYSPSVLVDFTHTEVPWVSTRGEYPADAPSDRVISKDTIKQFFTRVKDKYNMLGPEEIRKYAEDKFAQVR